MRDGMQLDDANRSKSQLNAGQVATMLVRQNDSLSVTRWALLGMAVVISMLLMAAAVRADDQPKAVASPSDKSAEEQESGDQVITVKPGSFKIEVAVKGRFEAGKTVPLSVRPESWSTLTVKKVIPHGSVVKKGDTVLWLETDKIDEAIAAAENGLQVATIGLRSAQADLATLEATTPLDLKAAERTKKLADEALLDYMKQDKSRSQEAAKRSLESARFSLEYAQEELNQLEKMYKADDLTEETEEIILKRAQRQVDASKFSLEGAEVSTQRQLARDIPRQQEQLVEAARRQDEALARARIMIPAALEKKRLELAKQESDLKKSTDDLSRLKRDRQLLTVSAPADGVLYYGRCDRGKWLDQAKVEAMLQPGGTLLPKLTFATIVSKQPLLMRADLEEAKLQHVRKGTAGIATPVAFPDVELPVKVTSLSYIPVTAGIFDCVMAVEPKELKQPIYPGMNGEVKLVAYAKENAITLPPDAVKKDDQGSFVTVLVKDKPQRRNVTLGHRTEKQVEIVKGLKAGDKVRSD